jgi:hypothetical protein
LELEILILLLKVSKLNYSAYQRRFSKIPVAICFMGIVASSVILPAEVNTDPVAAQEQSRTMTPADIRRMQAEIKRQTFESGRRLLLKQRVPFEPNQLAVSE